MSRNWCTNRSSSVSMSLLKRPMGHPSLCGLLGNNAPQLSMRAYNHGSWNADGSLAALIVRVAARVQGRYMRNKSDQGRIDACGNPESSRGNQAVGDAAKEASLTST